MTEITLDYALRPVEAPRRTRPLDEFQNTVPGTEWVRDGEWGQKVKPRTIIASDIPTEAEAFHKGFFGYLEAAYNCHHGIVVGPTTIWYTVLAEIAGHVKANAEHYRPLFTTEPGKTEITVYGNAEDGINPTHFLHQLRALVPVGTDLFLPEFSTADGAYEVASAAAFCDAVSPYYDYSMMLCGIPRVRVEGTVEDWDRLLGHLDGVAGRLDLAKDWFASIRPFVGKIRAAAAGEVDVAFWKDIYHVEECGSGGQVKVNGWSTAFAMDPPRVAYPENFPPHVSKVEVTQVETGRKYMFCAGILYSHLVDGYLEPHFASVTERLPVEAGAGEGVPLHAGPA